MLEDIVTPELLNKVAHDSSIIQQIEMILFMYGNDCIAYHHSKLFPKSTLEIAEEIFNLCKK